MFIGRLYMADLLIQTGALPWRRTRDDRLEVLLVTGRKSGRWLIPKGWPMSGKNLAEAAAQEAFEEAGVEGSIEPEPLGWFVHEKQHVLFGTMAVRIAVHRLAVERVLATWPEIDQRQRRWFTVKEASEQVKSPALAALIRQLEPRAGPLERR